MSWSCYSFLQDCSVKQLSVSVNRISCQGHEEWAHSSAGPPRVCCALWGVPGVPLHAWYYFSGHRTLARAPLWHVQKQVGKNGNLHTIFHVSHTSSPGSESIWHLIFERNYFFFFPQVSLCHGTRSTVLIFSSANGTWSVSRARATGKAKPSIHGRDTAPLGSLAFGNLEMVQLHVLSCCRLWWSVLQRAQHKDRSCISASCFLAGIQAGFI